MPRIFSVTRLALLLAVFGMLALMNAPLGVVAHYENEAEHQQAVAASGDGK